MVLCDTNITVGEVPTPFFCDPHYISQPDIRFPYEAGSIPPSKYLQCDPGAIDIYSQACVHRHLANDAFQSWSMDCVQHNFDELSYLSNQMQCLETSDESPPLSPSGASSLTASMTSSMVFSRQDPTFEIDMMASMHLDDCSKPAFYEQNALPYHNRGDFHKLDMYFLHPAQKDLRQLLTRVVTSSWFQNNEKEPEIGSKRSILSPFLQRSERGNSYRCLFDFCTKSFDRQDRALGHVRMHLGHRPFQCGGRCGASEWYVTLLMASHVPTDLSVPVTSVSFVCPTCRVISNDLKICVCIGGSSS
jgi:hypothetical protein